MRKLRLTLIGQNDDEILSREGLTELRRNRVLRLANEAVRQGCLLSYEDLSGLLLCSLSTLKRDIAQLEGKGFSIPLRRRRKNGLQGAGC